MSAEHTFSGGKAIGLAQAWYENGQPKSVRYFKDGKQDGLEREWYESGVVKLEANYKDGLRDGLQTIFPEDPDNIFNVYDAPPKCFASGKEVDISECAE